MKQVRKFLELSTAHLPEKTTMAIDAGTFGKKPTMFNEYGWLFHVPESAEDLPKEVICLSFIKIIHLAIDAGCDYVLFDRDADAVDWLPTFEW